MVYYRVARVHPVSFLLKGGSFLSRFLQWSIFRMLYAINEKAQTGVLPAAFYLLSDAVHKGELPPLFLNIDVRKGRQVDLAYPLILIALV